MSVLCLHAEIMDSEMRVKALFKSKNLLTTLKGQGKPRTLGTKGHRCMLVSRVPASRISKPGLIRCKRSIIRSQGDHRPPDTQSSSTKTTNPTLTFPRCTSFPADGRRAAGSTCRLTRKSTTSSTTATGSISTASSSPSRTRDEPASHAIHSITPANQLSEALSAEEVTPPMVVSFKKQNRPVTTLPGKRGQANSRMQGK